jgi:GNAT superfamily N-acetyltransferase
LLSKPGIEARLRLAVEDDAGEIADLFLASRRDTLPSLPNLHAVGETRRWIAEAVLRRGQVWVAERHGRILGFAPIVGDHLGHLYVQPGHHRRGIGDRLLAKAKEISGDGWSCFLPAQCPGAGVHRGAGLCPH